MATYRRERSTRLLVIALVLTSLITITADFRGGERGPLAVIGRVSLSIVSPLQEAVSKVSRPIGTFISDLTRVGSLREENEALRRQLDEVRGQQARFQELEAEAKELRNLLNIRDRLGFETVGASVLIGETPSNFEQSVIIDRGSVDGVEVNMAVIAADGLVGRVTRVTSNWSKVLLITDPNSAVAARLAASRETGILRGQRERDLRMSLVDPATPVEAGEQVVSSGQGGIFPPGIPVGVVSRVLPAEGALEKDVLVRPTVDFSRLSEVLVVLATQILAPAQK